jgi:IS605 OrfB family transposase
MKIVLKIKLNPTEKQKKDLLATMEQFNAACNYIAQVAYEKKIASKFKLQKLVYKTVKKEFKLSAQMTIRAIAKVCEAYCRDKKILPKFSLEGAIVYDDRIMSFVKGDKVSLWTIAGRQQIALVMADYQREQFQYRKGQADLVMIGNSFYLFVTLDIKESEQIIPQEFIGVDLGIVKLLVDSLGNEVAGELIEKIRLKYLTMRRNLQKCRSKNAKRKLKKIARKEAEFRRQVNHIISKALVKRAKDTNSGIALEMLKYIRSRTTVRRQDRAKHSGWAFAQLQSFILYKAKIAGVPVIFVDPRNSSRECHICHFVAKRNRPSQSVFCCVKCGHKDNADHNAAKNIAFRGKNLWASVNMPIAVHVGCPNAVSLVLQASPFRAG